MNIHRDSSMAWWGRSEVIIDGESVGIETQPVTTTGIEVGDRYVAQRNRGIQLLTCRLIHPDGWLEAEEPAYSYDLHECFRVKTGE